MRHGKLIGDIATAVTPAAALLGPEAVVGAAAIGKFASTYQSMRGEADGK